MYSSAPLLHIPPLHCKPLTCSGSFAIPPYPELLIATTMTREQLGNVIVGLYGFRSSHILTLGMNLCVRDRFIPSALSEVVSMLTGIMTATIASQTHKAISWLTEFICFFLLEYVNASVHTGQKQSLTVFWPTSTSCLLITAVLPKGQFASNHHHQVLDSHLREDRMSIDFYFQSVLFSNETNPPNIHEHLFNSFF